MTCYSSSVMPYAPPSLTKHTRAYFDGHACAHYPLCPPQLQLQRAVSKMRSASRWGCESRDIQLAELDLQRCIAVCIFYCVFDLYKQRLHDAQKRRPYCCCWSCRVGAGIGGRLWREAEATVTHHVLVVSHPCSWVVALLCEFSALTVCHPASLPACPAAVFPPCMPTSRHALLPPGHLTSISASWSPSPRLFVTRGRA